jgi:hypothetical protein
VAVQLIKNAVEIISLFSSLDSGNVTGGMGLPRPQTSEKLLAHLVRHLYLHLGFGTTQDQLHPDVSGFIGTRTWDKWHASRRLSQLFFT